MKLFTDKTFIKFVIVGILNTVIGMSIMFVFYNVFHLGYWFSSASNYLFGSIASYLLNKHFTFRYNEKGCRSLFRFTINVLVCYLLAYGVAKPIVGWMLAGMDRIIQDNVSMIFGMAFFVGFNYIGQRYFAFSPRGEKKHR